MTTEAIPVNDLELSRGKKITRGLRDFLVDILGQVRVLKKVYPGIMHFLIFWGMTVLTIGHAVSLMQMDLFIPFVELPFPRGNTYQIYEVLSDIAGIFVLVGVGMAAYRRLVQKPEHITSKWDDYYAITMLAIIPLLGFVNEGTRLIATDPAWANSSPVGNLTAKILAGLGMTSQSAANVHDALVWVHLSFGLIFMMSIPFTKLRHLVFAPLNILLRNRRKEGVLEVIDDIENADILGVGKVEEFTPLQLLTLDACLQCGRCQEACPVTMSGGEYSPKNLIGTLRDAMQTSLISPNGGNGHYDIFNDETAWGCTTCGMCLTVCPVYINPIDEAIDIRRYQVLTTGEMSKSVGDTLRNMERQGNPWGMPPEQKLNWAEGLDIKELQPGDEVDVLLFLGCSLAFDERNKKIARSMVSLLNSRNVDFGILGLDEGCCGETARRLGHEYLFQMMAEENIQVFSGVKFNKIVTQCPHCLNTIKNEYPQFGGNYEVEHITEYLSELPEKISLDGFSTDHKITYHDPCYLGRYNEVYEAPRDLLSGEQLEMDKNKEASFCCGGGGGHMWLETDAETRLNKQRLQQAMDTGADVIATSCPYCLTMFEDAVSSGGFSEKIQIMDITEILSVDSVEKVPEGAGSQGELSEGG